MSEQDTPRLKKYLEYFQFDGDAVYIRQDFIYRLKELKGKDLHILFSIIFGDEPLENLIKAFETGKYVYAEKSVCKKEKISNDVRWAVWERDNFTCQHCGARKNLSVDHIHPESKGGKATLENCQTLCRSCNSRKGAR